MTIKDTFFIISFEVKNKDKRISRKYRVHRLVALIFLNNPNNSIYNVVNHKDCVRTNNNLYNLEWVTEIENLSSEKKSKIRKEISAKYIGRDKNGNIVESFIAREVPEKYKLKKIQDSIYNKNQNNSGFCYGLFWTCEKVDRNIYGFSGNLDDYEWFEHWKYPGVYVCKEGFVKVKNKISYYMDPVNSNGYVYISIKQKSYAAHRVIMEYVLERDLKNNEIVDHIDRDKSNNSFSNLRLTDARGNIIENINTMRYISNDIVVTDLMGKLLFRGSTREVYKFIFGEKRSEKLISPPRINESTINNKRFICFKFGNINSLFKGLEKVIIIVTKDKKSIIGSYNSIISASNSNLIKNKIDKYYTIKKRLKDEKLSKNGYYYFTGKTAVNFLKDLGYLDEIIEYNLKET